MGFEHFVLLISMLLLYFGVINKEFWTILRTSTASSLMFYIVWVYFRGDYLEDGVLLFADIGFLVAYLYATIFYIRAYVLHTIKVDIPKDSYIFNMVYDLNQFEEYENKVREKYKKEEDDDNNKTE